MSDRAARNAVVFADEVVTFDRVIVGLPCAAHPGHIYRRERRTIGDAVRASERWLRILRNGGLSHGASVARVHDTWCERGVSAILARAITTAACAAEQRK